MLLRVVPPSQGGPACTNPLSNAGKAPCPPQFLPLSRTAWLRPRYRSARRTACVRYAINSRGARILMGKWGISLIFPCGMLTIYLRSQRATGFRCLKLVATARNTFPPATVTIGLSLRQLRRLPRPLRGAPLPPPFSDRGHSNDAARGFRLRKGRHGQAISTYFLTNSQALGCYPGSGRTAVPAHPYLGAGATNTSWIAPPLGRGHAGLLPRSRYPARGGHLGRIGRATLSPYKLCKGFFAAHSVSGSSPHPGRSRHPGARAKPRSSGAQATPSRIARGKSAVCYVKLTDRFSLTPGVKPLKPPRGAARMRARTDIISWK